MDVLARLVLRSVLAIGLAGSAILATPGTAMSSTDALQAPEPRVKAAFLFKFGSYVEWPPGAFDSPTAPFTIGVLAADDLADELTTIVAGRDVGGRPVVVRKLHEGDATAGMNILFVGKADGAALSRLLAPIKGRSILAVTESDGALERGSMVNFVVVDGKVRFDIALQPALASNLKISSRLLAVARKVAGPS